MSGKFTMERRSDDSYDILCGGEIVVQAIDADEAADRIFQWWQLIWRAEFEAEIYSPADAYLEGVAHCINWFGEK